MENFETFLIGKLSHLKEFYNSEDEFLAHLKSGEVDISIPDAISWVNEYLNNNLKSK